MIKYPKLLLLSPVLVASVLVGIFYVKFDTLRNGGIIAVIAEAMALQLSFIPKNNLVRPA